MGVILNFILFVGLVYVPEVLAGGSFRCDLNRDSCCRLFQKGRHLSSGYIDCVPPGTDRKCKHPGLKVVLKNKRGKIKRVKCKRNQWCPKGTFCVRGLCCYHSQAPPTPECDHNNPEIKPGGCPVINYFAPVECPTHEPIPVCRHDGHCKGDLKCCEKDSCGAKDCMKPWKDCPPVYHKNNVDCSKVKVGELCLCDNDCESGTMCCETPCGGTGCLKPVDPHRLTWK